MPNGHKEGLDRRDFMMAAIGLVGTSATFASSAGITNAQDTKAPAPGAPQRTPETAVADCLAEISIDGRSGNEGIVLFLGRDDGDAAEVTHLVKLRGPDIKKYPNFISIGASLFNEVADLASEHGARLIGQVHSHGPGYSLDLSSTDRHYGLHTPFYLSLVAPDYGLSQKPVETWGIHVHMENRGYVRLTPAEISRRIEIVLGAKLPVLTAGGDE